jgi:hypothetical protein
MKSGLSPADPTLVAAFRSALLHQAASAAAAAGQWSRLTTLPALAASAAGRECGLVAVNAVTFGPNNVPMTAGSCVRRGVAGVFADRGGAWQAAAGSSSYDALAVAGSRLTVWRLTAGAWAQVQAINVPITYGSSG